MDRNYGQNLCCVTPNRKSTMLQVTVSVLDEIGLSMTRFLRAFWLRILIESVISVAKFAVLCVIYRDRI